MKIYNSKYSYFFLRYKKLILLIISCSPIITNSASSIIFLLILALSVEILFSSLFSNKFTIRLLLFSFMFFILRFFDFCVFNIGFLLFRIVFSSFISFLFSSLFSSFVNSLLVFSGFGVCCSNLLFELE